MFTGGRAITPLIVSSCAQNVGSIVTTAIEATGSVTSATTTTLTDSTANWAVNQFAGGAYTVQDFTNGASSTAVSNTATTVTVSPAFSPTPAAGHTYNIFNYTNTFNWWNFGLYNVEYNNWGKQLGTLTQWVNSATCWGMSVTSTSDPSSPASYPHASRGWSNNTGLMNTLSTGPSGNTNDWTTQAGLGIQVSALTKCKVGWKISQFPTNPNLLNLVSRWDALIDIYLHLVATPPPSAFVPQHDIQIMQVLMDQPLTSQPPNKSGFWAASLDASHGFTKTLGGIAYDIMIDNNPSFAQPGGHVFTCFPHPTMWTNSGSTGLLWGNGTMVHDVKAMIDYFSSSNPLDDLGQPIKTTNGTTVTTPLISTNHYLTSINTGEEVNFGTTPNDCTWTHSGFWVAMQNEPDGSF